MSAAIAMPRLRPLQRHRTNPGELGEDSGVSVIDLVGPQGPSMLTVYRTSKDDVQDRQVYLYVDGEDWPRSSTARKSRAKSRPAATC